MTVKELFEALRIEVDAGRGDLRVAHYDEYYWREVKELRVEQDNLLRVEDRGKTLDWDTEYTFLGLD